MALLPIEISVKNAGKLDNLNRKLKDTEKNSKTAKTATDKMSASVKGLIGVAAGYIAIDRLASATIAMGKAFVSTADQMSNINSRLSLVTSGTQQLVSVQTQLLDISNRSRVSLQSTSDLYSQLARSTQSLGLSSQYLLGVTETISQTLIVSGASATSASAALFQLQQGLSAGALRGEELNSVMEQTPRLAQAIADGMGVSIGQLRQLGSEGALTAEKVLTALENQAEAVQNEFNGIAVTAETGYAVLQNNIDVTVAKLNEQHNITQTIGNSFIALGEVVDTLMVTAFKELTGESMDFGEVTVSVIGGVIGAGGALYDTFETIGDMFNVVKTGGKAAFYGLSWGAEEAAYAIGDSFTWVFNKIIDGFNWVTKKVIGGINSLLETIETVSMGTISLGRIDASNFTFEHITTDDVRKFADESKKEFLIATEEYVTAQKDLWTVSTVGRDTASSMIQSFSTAFAELQAKETTSSSSSTSTPQSFSDMYEEVTTNTEELADATQTVSDILSEANNTLEDTVTNTEDVVETISDLNDVLYNDDDSTYTVVTEATDSFDDLNDSVTTVIDSIDDLTFQFTDTFLNSITNNMSKLAQIGSSTAFNTLTYNQALQNAIQARNDLIANPLDVQIGEIYSSAYNQFVSSASDYLDPSNFRSNYEYRLAQATVGTQASQFEGTATQAYDVLSSMNDLLDAINSSLDDGVLTSDESTALTRLATDLNTKNETLLGANSAIVQNTTGLYTGQDIAVTQNGYIAPYTDYMKNDTFTDKGLTSTQLNNAGLYTGENITIDNQGFNQTNFTDNGLTNSEFTSAGIMKNSTFTDNGLTQSQLTSAGLYTGEDITVTQYGYIAPYTDYMKNDTFVAPSDTIKIQDNTGKVINPYTGEDITATVNTQDSVKIQDSAGATIDPYTGDDINATVNTISGFATSKDLGIVDGTISGTNGLTQSISSSTSTLLSSLTGDNSVNTAIATVKTSLDGTNGLKVGVDNVTSAVGTSDKQGLRGSITSSSSTLSSSLIGDNSVSTAISNVKTSLDGDDSVNTAISSVKTSIDGDNGLKTSVDSVTSAIGTTSESNTVAGALNLVNELLNDGSSTSTASSASSILSALTSKLSVATGLTDISTYAGTGGETLNTGDSDTYNALGGSSSGGVGLDNLRVKQQLTVTKYEGQGWVYDQQTGNYVSTYGTATGDLITGQSTSYTYYANGGFTGNGFGTADQTGQKPAGIVHENEWVAPRWMVESNPELFASLENARLRRSFADGGMVGNITATVNTSSTDNALYQMAAKLTNIETLFNAIIQDDSMSVKMVG